MTLGFDLKGNGFGLSTKEATSLEQPKTQRKATPVLQGENRWQMTWCTFSHCLFFPLSNVSDIGGPQLVSSQSSFVRRAVGNENIMSHKNQCSAGGYWGYLFFCLNHSLFLLLTMFPSLPATLWSS